MYVAVNIEDSVGHYGCYVMLTSERPLRPIINVVWRLNICNLPLALVLIHIKYIDIN